LYSVIIILCSIALLEHLADVELKLGRSFANEIVSMHNIVVIILLFIFVCLCGSVRPFARRRSLAFGL
jgi:hypothetical protein